MAHGTRDWDPPTVLATINSIDDLGELAARLGSPAHFDRRGEVMFIDSFEVDTPRYDILVPGGAGASIARSTEAARTGAYSYKFVGADDGNEIVMLFNTADIARTRIGVELSFEFPADFASLILAPTLHDGVDGHFAYLQIDDGTGDVIINETGGGPVTIDTGVLFQKGVGQWNTLKLVLDVVAYRYVRLFINERTYDLTAYGIDASSTGQPPHLETLIGFYSTFAQNDVVYLDDLIVTQNEPA